jgi:hypothetical protein
MKYFAYTLFAIGILNFTSFFIISLVIGGDAVNGKTEGGKYYVSEHGHDTEVSRSVFDYSRFHAHSVWVTHPLAFVGVLLLCREHEKRKTKQAA